MKIHSQLQNPKIGHLVLKGNDCLLLNWWTILRMSDRFRSSPIHIEVRSRVCMCSICKCYTVKMKCAFHTNGVLYGTVGVLITLLIG